MNQVHPRRRACCAARAATDGHVQIEVEDECGGIPGRTDDSFKAFSDRRMHDRTGLGLGLSIARKAVKLHGGDIHVRNLPGKGCVFVIELPLAEQEAPQSPINQ